MAYSNPGGLFGSGPKTGGLNPGIAKRPRHSDPIPRWRGAVEKPIARKSKPIPKAVSATGLKGTPNVRQVEARSQSFAFARPEAAFSYGQSTYTGGWATFGNPVTQALNSTGFGNTQNVSRTFNAMGAATGFQMAR